jgi:ArsR family transcriptional regulator, arsenate/arsenite/antimonite-responsive transcriptional repressor
MFMFFAKPTVASVPLTQRIYKARYIGVTAKLDRHAEQLGALGHPARLGILRHIVQAEGSSTTDLQAKLGIPWTTLNHHLDRLVASGLVATRRDGKFAYHTADYAALRALTDYLWEDCCKRGKGAPKGCC